TGGRRYIIKKESCEGRKTQDFNRHKRNQGRHENSQEQLRSHEEYRSFPGPIPSRDESTARRTSLLNIRGLFQPSKPFEQGLKLLHQLLGDFIAARFSSHLRAVS